MKLIVAEDSRKVLGCHIVGPGAGEMIQLAGIAVKMGATKGISTALWPCTQLFRRTGHDAQPERRV